MANSVEKIHQRAYDIARDYKNSVITFEHLLLALTEDEIGLDILTDLHCDIHELRRDLIQHIQTYDQDLDAVSEITESAALANFREMLLVRVILNNNRELSIADIFDGIFRQRDSFAAYFLEKQGISRSKVLRYITHGFAPDNDASTHFVEEESEISDGHGMDDEPQKLKNPDKVLKQFTVDMTAEAIAGKYDALIGREEELNRTMEILCRRNKNNALHIGEPGVGKTAIMRGLAMRLAEGKVPERIKGYQVFSIDVSSLVAGTRFRGDFEERLQSIIAALSAKKKVILYIDEIHQIVGAGATRGDSMDAANMLKPVLTRGDMRCVGATTHEEYRRYFEKDRALSRRFQKIDIGEPSREDAFAILKGLRHLYENYHKVTYSDEILKSAVDLSAEYITERYLPDKAIDVIDEAGASLHIYKPEQREVTEDDLRAIVSRLAHVNIEKYSAKEASSLKSIAENLKKKIFGQDAAIEKIARAVKRNRAGLGNRQKPIGSFLFTGPTGTGKTELARAVAEELGAELIRFDMSEYMEAHSVSRLLGSPPGYVGFDQGAQLTDAIRKHPHAVLLLDEIEKAHTDIFNTLLQIMDYATVTDATGKKADFRHVLLILTSNAGSSELSTARIGFEDKAKGASHVKSALKSFFTPEFLNRLDDIVVFDRLNDSVIEKIVDKNLALLNTQLKEKEITLTLDAAARAYLAKKGYDSVMGARPMARLFQDTLRDLVTDAIIDERVHEGDTLSITCVDEKLEIKKANSAKDTKKTTPPKNYTQNIKKVKKPKEAV
ncbi:MAG: ATP-dependent Clp protease ATP-binding subunit ClpA [Turneriella sp.]|nr:ATP-dependent Clp protease ATP-binding subunit ClpA [Turneriella sp.]